MRRVLLGCVAFVGAVVGSTEAAGQCITPAGIVDTFPADGSRDLPVNAVVRIRYSDETALLLAMPDRIRLFVAGVEERGTVGYDEVSNEAIFVPSLPLSESTRYDVIAADPAGSDWGFTFYTGTGVDDQPPTFGGVETVEANRHAAGTLGGGGACDTALGEGFVLTASFAPASDAAGIANIEYVAYLTRGAQGEIPIEQARIRGFVGALRLSFFLPQAEAEQQVCVNVQAVDLFGRLDGNTAQECVRPAVAVHFRGLCAVGDPAGDPIAFVLVAAVAAALPLARRRRSVRIGWR